MRSASSIQKRARERALPRLVAALVEFQKAQCYFMIAVHIAAVTTVSNGRLQPASLQQLYNTCQAVRELSISGILPITFTLLCLQYAGKSSWYLNLLSTTTLGISAASFFETGTFSLRLNELATLQAHKIGLSECGNHDPAVYCLTQYHFPTHFRHAFIPDFDIDSGEHMFAYSLLILMLMYIPLLKARISRSYQRCTMWLCHLKVFGRFMPLLDGMRSVFGRIVKTVCPRLLTVIWSSDAPQWVKILRQLFGAGVLKIRNDWQAVVLRIFYLVNWVFYFFCFKVFVLSLYLFIQNNMVNFDWTFGQIVGITVWAEPLVEYAYLEISESAQDVKSIVLCLFGQLLI